MRPRSLVISAGLHVAAFLSLMYLPSGALPSLPPPSPSAYQQGFAGREDKIVWYRFKDLPKISPNASALREPVRAEVKAKQAIVSSPKHAPKRMQVVLTPLPKADLAPLDLPNLLAVKLPPRLFTTPPDLVKPAPAEIAMPDAPAAAPLAKIDAPNLPDVRLPTKRYVPPKAVPPPRIVATIAAPVQALDYVPPVKITAGLPAIRLPSRAFVPPPARPAPERRGIGAVVEASAMAVHSPVNAAVPAVKLPGRKFVPPPKSTAARNAKSVAPPQIDAHAADVTIAIAALNPSTAPVKLPAASSPAQFSAGLTVRPNGAASEGQGKAIVVSDLYAHAPDLRALATEPPGFAYKRAIASGVATLPAAPERADGAIRVSNAPDPRFNGRDVYMMAIQMANLTSASGSWLMWYASRTADPHDLQVIAPPEPHRKVDPAYIASAVSDHVEGRVQLTCVIERDGSVGSIELLKGIDARLDRSAEQALSKWQFYPATRAGQPVAVDAVFEVPFVLADPASR